MKATELIEKIAGSEPLSQIASLPAGCAVRLDGVAGSLYSIVLAVEARRRGQVVVAVMEDRDAASYLYNDLYDIFELFGEQSRVLLLPTAYRRAITTEREDPSGIVQRTAALTAIAEGQNVVICTWGEALAEKVVSDEGLSDNRLTISCGDHLSMTFVEEVLESYHFERVDFVTLPGQYATRGGIMDLFSFADNRPYRLDFLGDEVDSIRIFSPSSQLTDQSRQRIDIVPNLKSRSVVSQRVSFTQFINATVGGASIWYSQVEPSLLSIDLLRNKLTADNIDEQLTSRAQIEADTANWTMITRNSDSKHRHPDRVIDFAATPQPSFGRNFEMLISTVNQNYQNGTLTYLLTSNVEQYERVEKIFADGIPAHSESKPSEKSGIAPRIASRNTPRIANAKIENIALTLHEGFALPLINAALYTDHQIFERYQRYRVRGEIDKAEGMTIAEFSALKAGDYIVHIDHGVGRFGGLVRQRDAQTDAVREFIKLTYRDGDVLFVGVQNLHRISKFKDGDSLTPPPLQKLGSNTWARLKETTKRRVKDIARELIDLYAKRKASEGFAFSPDSYLQRELEASFIYEDTPDQSATTDAVKHDMESRQPMDRLVCGDVGFGKTEIAIRAAFKAATDGKQVAILVPTTVLSLQHFRTFTRRLKDFPVRIENFSRVKSAKQVTEILADLKQGKIDILIGTHKLLGKTVEFKDLGLLVVDEEQKFGVAVKEKLRELKHSVDTLTLTATPIPRTLQFSLMGARDMSVINTPPPNRQPVSTEVHIYNDEIVAEAIEYELSRGGQVFFLHNRVQTIDRMAATIERLVPGAKVGVGHGQMTPKALEEVMMDFIYGEYNVLVATTIIESGIDIANANTIIINHAHRFGLSDLHQLRGRVGRTNRKAFCYLLIPSDDGITSDAQRRLRAIEEFSDLGSGFNIAMQDLDIRGAGNILGAEQSGFMADIGYETYQRIVAEAMGELYDELGQEPADNITAQSATDCIVEIDSSAHLPDSYIGSTSEKLKLYRELDSIATVESLEAFIARLTDRFGEPPAEARELFEVVLLRADAARLGFDKVVVKNGAATLYFAAAPQSAFYAGELFGRIMRHVLANPTVFRLKEGTRLSLAVRATHSVAELRRRLSIENN